VNAIALRRSGAGVVICATNLLSSAACAVGQPASGPSKAAASPPASAGALSAADAAIYTSVGEALRTMVMSLLSGGAAGGQATTDALREFGQLVRTKVAEAGDPALRFGLEELAVASERYAATGDRADGTAFGEAGERMGRTCGEPADNPLAIGDRVGPPGSACELPVSFRVAEKWQAASIDAEAGGILGDLVRRGPLTMACEIKARSAGHTAFLRVWTGTDVDDVPRQILGAYLQPEQVREPKWSDLTLGVAPAAEAVYGKHSELLDETRTERAFAVRTPTGVAVITLTGLDAEEDAVVAAYELAKTTLTVNP
jgi:hypothetical protein